MFATQSLARHVLALAFAAQCAACSDGKSTAPPTGDRIQLTSNQVALLVDGVQKIAPVHPDNAWLADSITLVLKAGAEADRVDMSTDLAAAPFFAVGLQREIVQGAGSSFGTFHFIAFNNPNAPTDFLIIGGFKTGSGATPPASVTGTFGASSIQQISGHLFHVAGASVQAWTATTGTATLSAGASGGACPAFPEVGGITCEKNQLGVAFTVTSASPDASASGTRSATLGATNVPGIRLYFGALP